MIPRAAIVAWRRVAPWASDAQVEQDLVLSRVLVELFSDEFLREHLAFRGGTALHKLFFNPATRYSEDIDLVQTRAGPIGPIPDRIRERLAWFQDGPRRERGPDVMHVVYTFDSEIEPVERLHLKIEINTREHESVLPRIAVPFEVTNRWFSGRASIPTFALEELLGTKLRALYQRKKGRDLYDFASAFERASADDEQVVRSFQAYMQIVGGTVTRAQFEANLAAKMDDAAFREDVVPLLREGVTYDADATYRLVVERLISRLEGEPWKGLVPAGPGDAASSTAWSKD